MTASYMSVPAVTIFVCSFVIMEERKIVNKLLQMWDDSEDTIPKIQNSMNSANFRTKFGSYFDASFDRHHLLCQAY